MRKYFILFFATIFLGGLAYYLASTLNPFDEEAIFALAQSQGITIEAEMRGVIQELLDKGFIADYLSARNLLAVGLIGFSFVLSGFVFLHMVIEKLFFRKFYEQPSIITALRRGGLLVIGIASIFILRLVAAEWYLMVSVLILIVLLEAFLTKFFQKVPSQVVSEEGEKELPIVQTAIRDLREKISYRFEQLKFRYGARKDRLELEEKEEY